MITTKQFPDLVKNATVAWGKGFAAVAPVARAMYDVYNVSEKTSEHSEMNGDTFAKRKDEGDKYQEGDVVQGYTTNFSQTRIGLKKTVTYEMRKFDDYRQINKLMYKLGKTCHSRLELDLTHQFTFGFAGSYVNMDGETVSTKTGDGLSIFHAAHTITGGSDTFSNKLTDAFGKASLEEAEQLFTKMIDNMGNKVIVKPDTIVSGDDPETVNAIREFLESTVKVDGSNGTTNVYETKYKHIILPYLATDGNGHHDATKAKYWFLADLTETEALCEISDNPKFVAPKVDSNADDFDTDDLGFKTNAMYDLGVTNARFIVGSDGTT